MSKLRTLRSVRRWVNRFRSGDTLDHLQGLVDAIVALTRGGRHD